jgi:hypothetical protein
LDLKTDSARRESGQDPRQSVAAGEFFKFHDSYNNMTKRNSHSPRAVDEAARKRRLAMQHLQVIEGNPLTADEIAMFEMFEREGWSHERRRAYIQAKFKPFASPEAAE